MKHNILVAILSCVVMGLTACKSNPHKAEKIDTILDREGAVSGTQKVGLKKGEMVVLDKVEMTEKLRDLQNMVYALEDKVYGTRKLGSLGLYGDLKSCKRKMASRQFGGSGTMVWTEPLDRVTDKEEDLKIGLDEKQALVGVSEEYLRDRIQRFQGYRMILQKRADEFDDKIESCKAELAGKDMDASQPSKVMVQEASKASADRVAIHNFMCGYAQSGASLQNLMINMFAKGWLSLSDYQLNQNLVATSLKDSKGAPKDNALLFSGWKLAYDQGPVTVAELLNDGKDARLIAWSYEKRGEGEPPKCMASSDGRWTN